MLHPYRLSESDARISPLRRVLRAIAAPHAVSVDVDARFPKKP
jgi:hypothetical protein